MFWRIVLTILANILAILGYFFLYWSDKQKLKRYRFWLLAGAIIASAVLWGDFIRETTEISKMQPKIVFLDNGTKHWNDPATKLSHTLYFFRSNYAVGLWDVQIHLSFNKRFLSATAGPVGGIVDATGSRLTIKNDSTSFLYTIPYLKEGNNIRIEVVSERPLRIVSKGLYP